MRTTSERIGLNGVVGLGLGLVLACGGGGGGTPPPPPPPSVATSLSYTDPASTGYRLVKNTTSSTPTHLVLDLIGPSGTQALGISLFLTVDSSRAYWVNSGGAAGTYIKPGTVFNLGTTPQILKDNVSEGNLQAAIFQQSKTPVTYGSIPILSVALDLNNGVTVGAVSLTATTGKQSQALDGSNAPTNITINVGTITAQ